MPDFKIVSDLRPTGDQPKAIETLVEGLDTGQTFQTLLGVTGSGKTFTMANVVERLNRPTLVLAHNKTLAAQLYAEFKEFFPRTPSNISSPTTTTTNQRRTFRGPIPSSRRTPTSTMRSTNSDTRRRAPC